MKLLKLTLTNFQGIRNFTLDTNGGKDVSIYSDNALGKTTIYNSFLWLLFEKDSLGRKDFEIKTRDHNGAVIPAINHEVEAVLDIDGKEVTLKRVFLEKYTKKLGSSQQEFAGHVTEHFIDGVPKSKGEYQSFIDSIAPEKLFMVLTSPTYFNEQLTWQERRKMLLSLCPSITDEQILASNPDLSPLAPILSKHSIDDAKKVESATRKKINDELTGIPGRIDEATRAIPGGATGNLASLAAKAQQTAKELDPLREEKVRILSGGQVAAKQNELAEIDGEIIALRNKHLSAVPSFDVERKALHDLANRLQVEVLNLDATNRSIEILKKSIEGLKDASRSIAARWKEQSSLVFVPGGACPTCGQDYSENMLAHQGADFNRAKSKALELIVNDGKGNESAWNKAEQDLADKIAIGSSSAIKIEEMQAEQQRIMSVIETSTTNIPKVEELPEYLDLAAKRNAMSAEIEEAKKGGVEAVAGIDVKIAAKQAALDAINSQITAIESAEAQRTRIEELKAREKRLAAEYEQSEKILYLIEQFILAKVSLLEESINGQFSLVNFKLFDEQINGGLSETCVCTIDGVPYPSINNAGRIQSGLRIISAFQQHHNIFAPVFVDNKESVTVLPAMPCQVISLVVSENDKALRVELC